MGKVIGRYAGARVGDRDRKVVASLRRTNGDGASVWREFHRIADQVREHTKDPIGVGIHAWRINELRRQRDPLNGATVQYPCCCRGAMPRKIGQLKADLRRAGFLVTDRGKGSHELWEHPDVSAAYVTLSGHDGDDAVRACVDDRDRARGVMGHVKNPSARRQRAASARRRSGRW